MFIMNLNIHQKSDWLPARTIVFLSVGLEGIESSENSWMQNHVDIVKHRTVAHLSIEPSTRGERYGNSSFKSKALRPVCKLNL